MQQSSFYGANPLFTKHHIANVLPARRLRQTRLGFLMSVASPSSTGVGHQPVICVRECLPTSQLSHLRESDSVNQTVLGKVQILVKGQSPLQANL